MVERVERRERERERAEREKKGEEKSGHGERRDGLTQRSPFAERWPVSYGGTATHGVRAHTTARVGKRGVESTHTCNGGGKPAVHLRSTEDTY